MVLPIFAYGQPVLKRVGADISADYPELSTLLKNMWETMYYANGVGLAAPQVGLGIRLFIVDTVQLEAKERIEGPGIKQVFINAQKIEETGEPWLYEEGCLSIPNVRGDVSRPDTLHIRYLDEQFMEQVATFSGMNARVIQHEYDHIEGILFTEHLQPARKILIRRKLENIHKGRVEADYRLKFAK